MFQVSHFLGMIASLCNIAAICLQSFFIFPNWNCTVSINPSLGNHPFSIRFKGKTNVRNAWGNYRENLSYDNSTCLSLCSFYVSGIITWALFPSSLKWFPGYVLTKLTEMFLAKNVVTKLITVLVSNNSRLRIRLL